jgi:hypothetical protein
MNNKKDDGGIKMSKMGWFDESQRHKLAGMGIRTNNMDFQAQKPQNEPLKTIMVDKEIEGEKHNVTILIFKDDDVHYRLYITDKTEKETTNKLVSITTVKNLEELEKELKEESGEKKEGGMLSF